MKKAQPATHGPSAKAMLYAILAAVVTGPVLAKRWVPFSPELLELCGFLGTLFLNALKLLVVPLILTAIISGLASLGGERHLGRMGLRTLGFYLLSSTAAILIGLALVNLIQPGLVDGKGVKDALGLQADASAVLDGVRDKGPSDMAGLFTRLVPPNIVQAAADGQMLGLIAFSLAFGIALAGLKGLPARSLVASIQGAYQTMLKITGWVMALAPFGVFGLVAKVAADTGARALGPLALFFFTVLAALAIHALLVLPLSLRFLGGLARPWSHLQNMAPALLTAFSSASSSATLPTTLRCLSDNAKVSPRVSSFVVPLGATVNMDGTALYECVAVLFIAQAYGLDLSLAQQVLVVWLALLTSIGVAGIPAASLVAIVIILHSVGLPAEGIGLILAVDRLLDMARTSVNVFSDSCGAVLVEKWETGKGKA
jgi:Na+/H+-dicarboxylate symporter